MLLGEDSGASQAFSNVGKRYRKEAERTFVEFINLSKHERRLWHHSSSIGWFWFPSFPPPKSTPRLKCHLLLITSCFCWSRALSEEFCMSRCWDKRVFPRPHCTRLAGLRHETPDNIHSKWKAFLIRPPRRWLSSLLILTVNLISFEDSFISPKKNKDKEKRSSGVGGKKNNNSPLKMSRNRRWQAETKRKRGLGSTCCCHFRGCASKTSH